MRRLPTYVLFFASFAAAVAACSLDTKLKDQNSGGSGSTGVGATGGTGTPPPPTGVPCEIAQVLASADGQCTSCHSSPPTTGVPMSLVSYADLIAASPSDPSKSNAQAALDRMNDFKKPMPPLPLPAMAASEIQTFQTWVQAGMPQGDCSMPPTPPPSIFGTPEVCTCSVTNPGNTALCQWTNGEHRSDLMEPGWACIACHQKHFDAPVLTAGGTVYPSAHEPDDCNGSASSSANNPLEVLILDMTGATAATLPVNSVGNFFLEMMAIPSPYTARVVDTVTGAMRVMNKEQTNGDCNLCHTATVAGAMAPDGGPAPGRIMAP